MEDSSKNLYTASSWRRGFAFLIDQMIVLCFFIPIFLQISFSWFQGQSLQISWRWILLCLTMEIAYRWFFLKLLGGTIGKLIFGLRVVSYPQHQELTWLQSLIRVLSDHFSIFFGEAFRVLAFLRFDRRHVSDWLAETQVVQFQPRHYPPRPHPILVPLIFVYLAIGGFHSAYRLMQQSEWDKLGLILHPHYESQDSPESGFD